MKNLKLINGLILVFSITVSCALTVEEEQVKETKHFDILFDVEEQGSGVYNLNFTVELDSGYYFVSPHSNGHHQRLLFSIENTDSLILDGELSEFPRTFEEYDDLSGKLGRYARETTKYSQNLKINTENDFELSGLIWFEVRPICQPYEIEFTISCQSGKLEVSKKGEILSNYPTFWDLKRVD